MPRGVGTGDEGIRTSPSRGDRTGTGPRREDPLPPLPGLPDCGCTRSHGSHRGLFSDRRYRGWEAFITCNNAPRWWAVIGYVPNVKGLGCDELTVPVELCSGENRLVVKLQRFWERRWMFYARLSDEPK